MHFLRLVPTLFFVSLAAAWTTYTVQNSPGYDDTTALASALASNKDLTSSATILFQKGVTYNISTPITFPELQNVIISIQGNITYGADIEATQGKNSGTMYRELLVLTFDTHSHQQLSHLR